MRIVILWAGIGRRISSEYGGINKALVLLNGRSLMSRLLENIEKCGFDEIIPILGYRSEIMFDEIKKSTSIDRIKPFLNNEYERTNNMVSLMKALDYLRNDDFVVLNGDMVFDFRILKKVMEHQGASIAIDGSKYNNPPDSPGVIISLGNIRDIGRHIPKDNDGYAIGIYKFSPELTERYQHEAARICDVDRLAGFHEPLRAILKQISVKPVYTDDYKWMDVDKKSDVIRAEKL